MNEEPSDEPPVLVEVGRYPRLSLARERGLVVSAMELPHWTMREGDFFVLRVEPAVQALVSAELAKFEAESAAALPRGSGRVEEPRVANSSLYVAGWLMCLCWWLQSVLGGLALEQGAASSIQIMQQGQWWRVFTALTLHGDVSHWFANLLAGLMFGAFAIRHFGGGLAWLGIVLSGALGNGLNAWFYSGQSHVSIGASSAVFGALGLLVGAEFVARLETEHGRGRWQLILPLGAGLGLLAFLGAGSGERNVDYMAHFWGWLAGLTLGVAGRWLGLKGRATRLMQWAAGVAAPTLLAAAWGWALRG